MRFDVNGTRDAPLWKTSFVDPQPGISAPTRQDVLCPFITPEVPYAARHTYSTYTVWATGNLFAVRDQMGHADIKSMAPYQHQQTDELVIAVTCAMPTAYRFPWLVTLSVARTASQL